MLRRTPIILLFTCVMKYFIYFRDEGSIFLEQSDFDLQLDDDQMDSQVNLNVL